ncbi:bifunctional folylpolyglutamate synthase/dihydrofolate synthase [Streptococcus dentiloxodontae]
MIYQEALDWIHSQLKFGIKPGLERVAWMLEELGNPQKNIAGIHVVGTNGKGSTVNYLQHIFTAAGYEVGTFTSPFIMDFRERISINGHMLSKDDFVKLVERVKPVVERLPRETNHEEATEFEIITVIMFVYFGQYHPVDLAVIEAGMGGRDDSTNSFNPLAVICTSIGLDHQKVLGETYKDIAAQKADVLKTNVPFIFAENRADVRQLFYQKAKETQSKVYELGRDFEAKGNSSAFDFSYGDIALSGLSLAMNGQHQVSNASLAIMTSLLLAESYPKVTTAVIAAALKTSFWLGRTELIFPNLMIDGAHNNESIAALVALLQERYVDKQIHLLFSAIDTKPIDSMLEQLSVYEDVTVTSFSYPNALALEAYPSAYPRVADFQTWLAQHYQKSDKDLYVITGSLYFISQVRQALLKSPQE